MSNKFKNIENVYFDDGEAGKMGDAYIYNMSFTQNYSSSPSTLTINAVSEDGVYSSIPAPNFSSVYALKIGSRILFKGYIISKETSFSQGEMIAAITLVDKSVDLDRYGIGLANRHATGGEGIPTDIYATAKRPNPLGDEHPDTVDVVFQRKIVDTEKTGVIMSSNMFVIGREKLTSTECDIPDVEYNSVHFAAAISHFSSTTGLSFSSLPPIINGRNYTGTIREVLNSLCSDSGMSFYYDSSNDTIELFTLDSKLIDNAIIENIKNDENITISNFTESESLEGTFANSFSVREMRPGSGGISEMNLECAQAWINAPAFRAPSGLGSSFFGDHAGMMSKISSGIRDRYCYEHGQYHRLGWTNVYEVGRWNYIDPHVKSTDPNAPAAVDNLAWYIGVEPDEMRTFIANNPQLQTGFKVFAVNIDEGLKDAWKVDEQESLDSHESYYKAVFSPDALLYSNRGSIYAGGISKPVNSNMSSSCNVTSMTQEPEPTWQEPRSSAGFWGWKMPSSWDFGAPAGGSSDLSDFSYLTRIAALDITTEIYNGIVSCKAHALTGEPTDCSPLLSNQSTLLFVPIKLYGFISDVSISQWDSGDWSKYWLGDNYNAGYDSENCVPYLIVRHGGKTKTSECGGKPCIDSTLERAFDGVVTNACSNERLPSGEVCQRKRWGIRFTLNGSLDLVVASPWQSLAGFRSNIITKWKRNSSTETDRVIKIVNGFAAETNNFAKLNINDIDATSEIFDPKSNNGNFITPKTVNTTLQSTLNSASSAYSSFTKGSSVNGLPRSISISIKGIPSNLDKVLDLKCIKDWGMTLGSDGISMSLNYTDAPSTPPSMDFLQSKLHNQFHYVTMNGQ